MRCVPDCLIPFDFDDMEPASFWTIGDGRVAAARNVFARADVSDGLLVYQWRGACDRRKPPFASDQPSRRGRKLIALYARIELSRRSVASAD